MLEGAYWPLGPTGPRLGKYFFTGGGGGGWFYPRYASNPTDTRSVLNMKISTTKDESKKGNKGLCRGASLGFRQNGLTGLSWNRRVDQRDQ